MTAETAGSAWLRRNGLALAGAVAAILALLPVLAARHLPLLDAPGHEARLTVLRHVLIEGRGSEFYDFTGFFLPNVAFDVIGLGLGACVGPETTGKIFFALTMLLTLGGVWTLNRVATGRWSLTPLLATMLLYNLTAILGFFSYSFGLALVSWALAGRMALGNSPWRHALGVASGLVLLFCHVFDFGIYATVLAGIVGTNLVRRRISALSALASLAELAPGLILFALMSTMGQGHNAFPLPSIGAKLFGLFEAVTSGSMTGDAAFVIGALPFAALLGVSWRTVRLAPGFLLGILALAVLYVALPNKLASGSYVDSRMPVAIGLVLLAGLDVRPPRSTVTLALVAVVGAAVAAKQLAIASLWRSFDPAIDAFAHALDALPQGAIILQTECEPDATDIASIYRERQPSMTHLPAMAAFDDTRFVAATWAAPGQQTIAVTRAYRPWYDLQDSFGSSSCTADRYRAELVQIEALAASATSPIFFILIRPPVSGSISNAAQLVGSGPAFEIYRVQ